MGILRDQPPPDPDPEVARDLAARIRSRPEHAVVLTGVRRSGKSVLQAQLLRRAKEAFYCNLEDTRLYGLTSADAPTFSAAVDDIAPGRRPVFLDEVQALPEWQRIVRGFLDRGRPVCLTGSNASLLGRERGGYLTGRHLSYEVFPFAYSEYLAFAGGAPGRDTLVAYLEEGGFPGFLRERDPQILQELLRDIVQRDIAVRYRLRETRHVMNLALFLLANTGRRFSLQTLTKSLAVPTVAQTSRYMEYLQDAYLIQAVPKFSPSFKRRVTAPNKYYAIDNGLRRAVSPQASPDVGHRLENAVFLELRRRGESVHYAGEKDAWECDFLTREWAIQVCAELTAFNQSRELGGLRNAARQAGRRKSVILTLDQRDTLTVEGVRVEVRPAWEWLASR